MSQSSTLILLGILVGLAPFSGLPLSWLEILLPICGISVAFIGYVLRNRKPSTAPAEELPG